jgi:hypothetical protein
MPSGFGCSTTNPPCDQISSSSSSSSSSCSSSVPESHDSSPELDSNTAAGQWSTRVDATGSISRTPEHW